MKAVIVSAVVAVGIFAAAPAMANLDLAKKSNCMACHAVDKKLVGPAYQDVAKKYAGDKTAEATLAKRIKGGTSANGGQKWAAVTGGTPMPPNAVSDADATTLAKWILGGAK
ncbi:MAG TPA: c-type cytochrome [Rhodocyclaceae bacterium]|jgi:cytochrome c|nr:c-type cytochrome [Rhodocyclaceae bacterium]